jgi:hypothetical protein
MRGEVFAVDGVEHFGVGKTEAVLVEGVEEGVVDLSIEDELIEIALVGEVNT